MIGAFLRALIGALANRLRGGMVGRIIPGIGTQLSRVVFAVMLVGSAAWQLWAVEWWMAVAAVAWWLSCIVPLFGSIDMGRNEGTVWGDAAKGAARGLIWAVPAAAVLWWQGFEWWPMVPAGLLFPVCYEIGWRLDWRQREFRPTEVGEWLFGFCLGAGQSVAIYLGSS